MHTWSRTAGLGFGALALGLSLGGCAATPAEDDWATPEDFATQHAGVSDGRVDGDWSLFPDYVQCLVGAQIFYPKAFGVGIPTARDGWTGDCAPDGACHIWLDDIPDPAVWERIPNDGTRLPSTYDLIVYPPITYANGHTNPWGHVAAVDHVGEDGRIYVMDTNWNGDERRAPSPHTVEPYVAYGWYHLASLPTTQPGGGSGGSDGCGGVDYAGYCDGGTIVWCENGGLRSKDCAAAGQVCGWANDAIGNDCLAPAAAPAGCGAIGYAGECHGTELVWCEGGELESYQCANAGMSCGWQNDAIGYNCL